MIQLQEFNRTSIKMIDLFGIGFDPNVYL